MDVGLLDFSLNFDYNCTYRFSVIQKADDVEN